MMLRSASIPIRRWGGQRLVTALAVLSLLLCSGTANADYLEVRRSALLKDEPISDGAMIDRLEPGEFLLLLDDGHQQNGYYRASLASGDEGYIYRTLVRRFPGSPPGFFEPGTHLPPSGWDAFQIADSTYTRNGETWPVHVVIGSWNIKWFGNSGPEAYSYPILADFIEECDVVAIQELRGEHMEACIERLLDELSLRGRDYEARIGPLTGYLSHADSDKRDYLEAFAFIWDSQTIELSGQPGPASSPSINHSVFRQVPFVADFKVLGGEGFDFRLLSTHTVYNSNLNEVRRAEIEWIRDWMLSAGDDDDELNLIAIGDFNANPDGQPHHFEELIPDGSDFRVLMYESMEAGEDSIRTTVPLNDSSPNPDYFRLPVYDHILVTFETSDALPADPMTRAGGHMGVYAFDEEPWWDDYGWTRSRRRLPVSDHRPIWFRLLREAEDED